MFYRAVHVVIGGPPKHTNASDNGDITICTNIGLIRAAGRTGSTREVHIIMRGLCQPADLLHRQLQLAGLGGEAAWPAVERLHFDMRDSDYVSNTYPGDDHGPENIKVLNDFLSRSFPSLLEIEYYGPNSSTYCRCILLQQLIKERLYGSIPLRAVRVKADFWPVLTDDYATAESAPPIQIECFEIEGPDSMYVMPTPLIIAGSLVKLKVVPVVDDFVWLPYVGEVVPGLEQSPLSFSSLRSLTLTESDMREVLHYGTDSSDDDSDDNDNDNDDDDDDNDNEQEDEWTINNVEKTHWSRFSILPRFDQPTFPVLANLDLRNMLTSLDFNWETYAASPITSLQLYEQFFGVGNVFDLSIFPYLHRLSIRLVLATDRIEIILANENISAVLSTVSESLQHLTLGIITCDNSILQFTAPPFADSLDSLTLEGECGQHDVDHFLQLFPNLRELNVCAIFSNPIHTVPEAVEEYRRSNAEQLLTPLNYSLRVLNAYGEKYFTGFDGIDYIPDSMREMKSELDHYRGMLAGLVCRLPALYILRVGAQSVDGVIESIAAIADTKVGPEYIGRLQRLRVRPLDY
ncbi:hypothetical protein H4S07_002521 [Coemansia furcata]|uniref:Uncharacterized protein n=1 Tax=Coemansia furcata TaxID=417177 RepID=A0ACC1LLC3_9FUNG|nr:hypothetical protein H4S07_002521 [Coemansia furcata]